MGIASKSYRGLTLIELMISIAIISIMAGVIIVSMSSGKTDRELDAAAREFASIVREAQNYALTGKQLVANSVPCKYHLTWVRGRSDYSLMYEYELNGTCVPPSPTYSISYTLKNGVTFATPGIQAFYFSPPHGTLSFDAGVRSVGLSKDGQSRIICIHEDGRVEVKRDAC